MANSLFDLGRKQEAIECYKRSLEIDHNYKEAHYNLGHSLSAMGKNQ